MKTDRVTFAIVAALSLAALVGKSYGATKARPDSEAAKSGLADWKDDAEMLSVIDTAPKFQVEGLLKQ